MDGPIFGDPARQAIESLRGYAYQLYASAIAWIALPQHGRLHLEVAEDYATLVANTLRATQVKATSASITLNSPSVRETINSLFDLRERNSGNVVTIEYLTTSVIGREAAAKDLVRGVGGLEYWVQASNGADIQPLRKRLLELPLSPKATFFLNSASDDQLRDELVTRINWRCGEPPLDDLQERLQEFAIYRCEQKGEPIKFADSFTDKILVRILETVVQKPPKPLSAAHLLTIFDEVTRTSVRTSVLEQMLEPRGQANGDSSGSIVLSQPALEDIAITPFILAPRKELTDKVSNALQNVGVAWLHAGTGYGKTTLAMMMAGVRGGVWKIARCTGLDAKATVAKLRRASIEIGDSECVGIVIDDLDQLSNRDVQASLGPLFRAARSHGCVLVATSHEVPQPMRLREWSLTPEIVVPVEDLSEDEVKALVAAEGGDPRRFGRYVYMGSAAGHPQLTHALILSLKSRDWPEDDIQNLAALVGGDADLQAVREEVRRRLLSELPASDLELLGRLTLVIGPFPRSLAMALAEKPPEIEVPGASFDRLLGPWIDTVSKERFRPSSLVSGIGTDLLGPEALIRFNGEIARLRIPGRTINAEDADGIFLNAVIGKAEDILEIIFTATFGARVKDFPKLAQALQTLCLLRTDQPLFEENPKLSAQIRALQVLLVAASGRVAKLLDAIAALDRQLKGIDEDYASTLKYGVIGKLSLIPGVFDFLPGYVTRVAAIRHDPGVRRKIEENFSRAEDMPSEPDDVIRSMFAYQMMTIKEMSTLSRYLDEVGALPESEREFFLNPFEHSPGDKALAVRGPWRAVSRDSDGSKALVAEYLVLAEKALGLGDEGVGLAAYETAAVITDEELADPDRALDILEIAKKRTENTWSLDRHRSRIFFNMKRYKEQLEVAERLIKSNSAQNVEMTYLLRETAIAYAHTGQHGASADCFRDAATAAAGSKVPDMQLMALGLRADEAIEAFEDGQRPRALKALVEVLPEIESLTTDGPRQIELKALVPHTIAAISGRCTRDGSTQEPELFLFPGLNSNPNPRREITDLKTEQAHLIWIVLYHLERLFECDCGVGRMLRSPEWDDRILTSTDRYLIQDLFQESFLGGDVAGFCQSVVAEAEAKNWTRNANLMLPFQESSVGRIPHLLPVEVEAHRSFIAGAALLFIVYNTLDGRPDVVDAFLEQQGSAIFPPLTADDLASLRDGIHTDDNLESAAVGTLCNTFRNAGRLSAEDAFIIGMRVIGMRSCDPTGKALDRLYDWLLVEWGHIVRDQRFRLRAPDGAAAVIDRQMDKRAQGIAGLVELYRAIRPHIVMTVSPSVIEDLMEA